MTSPRLKNGTAPHIFPQHLFKNIDGLPLSLAHPFPRCWWVYHTSSCFSTLPWCVTRKGELHVRLARGGAPICTGTSAILSATASSLERTSYAPANAGLAGTRPLLPDICFLGEKRWLEQGFKAHWLETWPILGGLLHTQQTHHTVAPSDLQL